MIRLQQKHPNVAELFAYIIAYIPLCVIYMRLLFENVWANRTSSKQSLLTASSQYSPLAVHVKAESVDDVTCGSEQ